MDKIMGFYISPDLMFSITFVSVMHFHNHLCMSISPKILKEILPKYPQLYRSYYPHRSRDSLSPVCRTFSYKNQMYQFLRAYCEISAHTDVPNIFPF